MFANAHFRTHDKSGRYTDTPFKPAHFLGEETRETPKAADPLKEAIDKMAVITLNRKLSAIKKGAPPPEGLPDIWTRPYEGKVN
jgi:hypothetical protein